MKRRPKEARSRQNLIMTRTSNDTFDVRRALTLSSRASYAVGAPLKDEQAPQKLPERRRNAASGTLAFALLIAGALLWGWRNSDRFITPENGAGYYLGIVGGLAMLALLAYPLRKHARFMRRAGPVSFWFRGHMALGLIGPTLILYHANFRPGSLNSNVALWSMLIVAGSGLFGRYFYAKIHRGLYGARAEVRDLVAEAATFRAAIGADVDRALASRLDELEKAAFADPRGMASAARKATLTIAQARSTHRAVKKYLRREFNQPRRRRGGAKRSDIREHLDFAARYFKRVEQGAEIAFYERLFAAWHFLHLPLFLLLILTAIVHVVAVHLY